MRHLPDPERQPQFYESVPSKRFFAWIIDSLLIFVMTTLIVVLTGFVGIFIWPLLYLSVGFVYRYVTLARGSATWGMRFAGIELRAQDGTRLDNTLALMHTGGFTLSMAIPILQVASIAMMLTTARGQGLTDSLIGTVALNRRSVQVG